MQIENFVSDYFQIFLCRGFYRQIPRERFELLAEQKNDLMKKHQIWYFNENDKEAILDFIEKRFNRALRDFGFTSQYKKEKLVRALFMEDAEINEQEQVKYLKVIKNFLSTNDINTLYNFGHIFDENELHKDKDNPFEEFYDIRHLVRVYDINNKAKALGQISSFIENTKHLEHIQNTLATIDPKFPEKSFETIINAMNQYSAILDIFEYIPSHKILKF